MGFRIGSSIAAGVDAMGVTATADAYGTKADVSVASLEVVKSGSFQPAISVLAGVSGSFAKHYLWDFYYHIWVVPATLVAQNPEYDVPIPFAIWNAYPYPLTNDLNDISVIDGDGLVIDGVDPATFRAIEYRTMGVIITPDAPGSVDAYFTFDFASGDGFLRFIASIANIIALPFEDGIRVDYEWLTDVLARYGGDEQRLALRERPRRAFSSDIVILDDAERKTLYDLIYKTATSLITIPMYQHQTPLRAATVIGDNKIYCNVKRADLRVGGYVLLMRKNGDNLLNKVSAIFADHVEVETAHSQVVPVSGTKVMSAITTRLPDQSGLSMGSINGEASFTFQEYAAQDTLPHPQSTATLTTHYGTPVLERRPLAADGDEKFGTGMTTIDNETGRPVRFTAWDQKYVAGDRSYLINTLFDQDDLDYWLTFLEYCRGRQKTFLASTWRVDLELAEGGTGFTNTTIEVAGLEYAQLYAEADTYRNLEIETNLGTFWVQIEIVTAGLASTTLAYSDIIADDLTGVEVTRISYLMRNRLGNDRVGIAFRNTYATITLSLKAV